MNRRSFIGKLSLGLAAGLVRTTEAFSFISERLKTLFPSLYLPGHKKFKQYIETFNVLLAKKSPLAILRSKSVQEIASFIRYRPLASHPIYMRSGGHSYAAFSTGEGLVLDSRAQKTTKLHHDTVELSSGLTLQEAFHYLETKNLTYAGGAFPTVGLAGYFLGGGHSRRSRYLGIGADSVQSMDVVLASGDQISQVSPNKNADLFWAMLGGGGGNFAFVNSFYLKQIPTFQDYFFKFSFKASQMDQAVELCTLWEKLSSLDPHTTAVNLTIYIQNGYIYRLIISGLMMNVADRKPVLDEKLMKSHWGQLATFAHDTFESKIVAANNIKPTRLKQMAFKGSSHYADQAIGRTGFEHLLTSIKKKTKNMSLYMGFYVMGGMIQKPETKIAYPHRSAQYMVDLFSNFKDDPSAFERLNKQYNSFYHDLDHLFSGRSYVNYPNLDFENWAEKYYGDSLEQLIAVKRKYDPHNRFHFGAQSLSSLVQ